MGEKTLRRFIIGAQVHPICFIFTAKQARIEIACPLSGVCIRLFSFGTTTRSPYRCSASFYRTTADHTGCACIYNHTNTHTPSHAPDGHRAPSLCRHATSCILFPVCCTMIRSTSLSAYSVLSFIVSCSFAVSSEYVRRVFVVYFTAACVLK